MTYAQILSKHADELGKILVMFSLGSDAAIRMLEDEKRALGIKLVDVEDTSEAKELYDAVCYNALAVIRSAIEQDEINAQLTRAVKDAKSELEAILEYMKAGE